MIQQVRALIGALERESFFTCIKFYMRGCQVNFAKKQLYRKVNEERTKTCCGILTQSIRSPYIRRVSIVLRDARYLKERKQQKKKWVGRGCRNSTDCGETGAGGR